MSKVHTQEQTKVISVTIELTPDEARKLQRKIAPQPTMIAFGQYDAYDRCPQQPDGLEDLRAQLKQALDGKN